MTRNGLKSLLGANGKVTAEYVVAHAALQAKRGKKPSLPFLGIRNPEEALYWAKRILGLPVTNAKKMAGIYAAFLGSVHNVCIKGKKAERFLVPAGIYKAERVFGATEHDCFCMVLNVGNVEVASALGYIRQWNDNPEYKPKPGQEDYRIVVWENGREWPGYKQQQLLVGKIPITLSSLSTAVLLADATGNSLPDVWSKEERALERRAILLSALQQHYESRYQPNGHHDPLMLENLSTPALYVLASEKNLKDRWTHEANGRFLLVEDLTEVWK